MRNPSVHIARLLALAMLVAVALAVPSPASAAARWVGYYASGAPWDMATLDLVEASGGRTAKAVNLFQDHTYFPSAAMSSIRSNGSVPLVTMEFWDYTKGTDQPALSLDAIARGDHDAAIRRWAGNAKGWGDEIWLRPFHEMNGNWYPWGGTVNGNTPADFVPAWKHVVDVVRSEGATNVKFVWSPNAESVPGTAANAIASYWPGDAYVDYLSIDGYDFNGDKTFVQVFALSYKAVTALSSKPLFIGETATGRTGTDKAAWTSGMFRDVPIVMPRIEGVLWFQANKERDWRCDTCAASTAAWKAGVATWSAAVLPPVAPPVVAPPTAPTPPPAAPTVRSWTSRLSGTGTVYSYRYRYAYLKGYLSRSDGRRLAGRTVSLYRRTSTGSWARVATKTTSSTGSYSFRQYWKTRGTRYYQVRFAGATVGYDRYAKVSKGYTLRVR